MTSELQLVLLTACPQPDAKRWEKIRQAITERLDWDLFVKLAIHHRVYPLVYKTLNGLTSGMIDESILMQLRQKTRANVVQTMGLAGETVRIVKEFEANDITTIVLKGAPLAQYLYQDVGLRPSRDIDILVWPQDLERGGELLEQAGYQQIHPAYSMTPARWRLIKKYGHHICYVSKNRAILVELHWQMGHCGLEYPLPKLSQIARISIADYAIPILSAEEWLLSLVLHGALHGWIRLRWLCDIGEFMGRDDIDWEKVQCLADELGVRSVLYQALLLASELLTAPIPKSLQGAIPTDRKARKLAKLAMPLLQTVQDEQSATRDWKLYWKQKQYDLQLRTQLKHKRQYVMSHFTPSETDVAEFSLPDQLFPLYYFIRPMTWLWKRFQ